MGWVVNATLRLRPGAIWTGGWVGPRAGVDGCGISRPYLDSIPGLSSPSESLNPRYLLKWMCVYSCVCVCVCVCAG